MEEKTKRPPIEVTKEIKEEYSDADIHKMAVEMAESANKAEMERIEKEEAAKKTAELNALASETVTEELTPEQNEKFEKYIEEGDKLHKTKDYHSAILQYKLALAMKPNDKAANNKVLKCQNWIDKLKAKNDIEENH